MGIFRSAAVAASFPTLCLTSALCPTAVAAQEAARQDYALPAQPLAASLQAVAAASGRSIAAPAELVREINAPPLVGAFTAEEAVAALLTDTGLRVRQVGRGLVVERDPSSSRPDPGDAAIVVTGTRIRGAPVASPVVALSQEEIRNAGQSDLGDVARSLPQSFGGGQNPGIGFNVPTANGGNVGGGSSFNLRGLGSDATLTLLNGRRMPYSASRQSIDVSSIPLAAVERIEIVADGASALYGSDAVAGVVNIILLRDFEGLDTRARLGAATEGGHFQQQYSATGGARWRSGGAFATYEFSRTTAITAEDRDYAGERPGVTLLPGNRRHAITASAHQDVGENLSLEFDGFFNSRRGENTYPLNFAGDLSVSRTVQSFAADTYAVAGSGTFSQGDWRFALTGTFGEDETDFRGDTYLDDQLSTTQQGTYTNRSVSGELAADGPIAELPAGSAKLAFGAGIRANDFRLFRGAGALQNIDAEQDSLFGYGELSVPLVSPAMDIGLVHRLNVSAAARYERYNEIGDVATPKLGVIYAPSPDLDLKASWGKSFRAPTFIQQYGIRQAIVYPVSIFGGTGFPPGSTALAILGGNADLAPERATSWSATIALHPRSLPGTQLEISYFSTKYVDRIVNPIPILGQALADPAYAPLLTFEPTEADQAALIAGASELIVGTGSGYDPALVAVLVNSANTNAGRQSIQGVDVLFNYTGRIDGLPGDFGLRLNGSYLDSEQQLSEQQPVQPLAGIIFNPPHFRTRGAVTWSEGGLTLAGTVSHIGGVEDPRQSPAMSVSGMTTLDLSGRYAFDSGLLDGFELSLAVQNLFNDEPATIPTTLFFDTPYDSTNYSPVGRFISIGVAKKW